MRRQNTGRPPYALLPMALILVGLYLFGGKGSLLHGLAGGSADPAEALSHIDAGIEAQHGGDTHRADDEFRRAVGSAGNAAPNYVSVAATLIQRDFAPSAVNLLLPASKESSTSWDPMIWATLGDAYRRADDGKKADESDARADQAAQALESSVGANPNLTQGDHDEESLHLRELSAYYDERKKDAAKAIQTLRVAALIAPDDPTTLNALGYLLADKGATDKERKEAVEITHKAVQKLGPQAVGSIDYGMILDSYGWALEKTGDHEGARRVLIEASSDDPGESVVHYHLGVAYAALSAVNDAAVELDRALELQPTFPEAKQARSALPPLPPTPTPSPSPSGFSLFPAPSGTPSTNPSPNSAPSPAATPLHPPGVAPPDLHPSTVVSPAPLPPA